MQLLGCAITLLGLVTINWSCDQVILIANLIGISIYGTYPSMAE